ncbi:MAG: Gfo/Idh/MocA family oxidoreductase [Terracidiphilus sp.]|jgi:predicted dehydrogenase
MIRVGLVGFGMVARVFHAPLISSVEGLELAAVMERTSNKAAERYPGIITYRTLEAMLADASLGLFVVATPSQSHFEVASQILKAGKILIVDKPMCTTSAEIAQLMELAAAHNALLIPFHNRRWDSDFQTIQKLLHEGSLGHLVYFESRFDRWRPVPPTDRLWKEDPSSGGVLLDLGSHLADQALTLFGKPDAVSAEILCEREWARACDSFTLRLRYPGFLVVLGANCLTTPARPRFHLRGTKGNYLKLGLDPQEAALNKVTRIDDPAWGKEPAAEWGNLILDVNGSTITKSIEPIPGDYRLYYAGVRDALLGKSPAPVPAVAAWRVVRLLEWALESSDKRREIICDWREEPK